MRTRVAGVAAIFGLVIAVGLTGSAVAAKRHAYSSTLLGARISTSGNSFQAVLKVTESGRTIGAVVQVGKTTGTRFPLTGSDTSTSYEANGVSKGKETFKLGKPSAKGISAITGRGTCVGGTGIYKNAKCSYTFTGTYNTKTTIAKVKVTGTATF